MILDVVVYTLVVLQGSVIVMWFLQQRIFRAQNKLEIERIWLKINHIDEKLRTIDNHAKNAREIFIDLQILMRRLRWRNK